MTAANCASCHGVHSILPSSDARSTVNAANLRKTCGVCHKGVKEGKFAIGPVHVQTSTGAAHPVSKVGPVDVLDVDPNYSGIHDSA